MFNVLTTIALYILFNFLVVLDRRVSSVSVIPSWLKMEVQQYFHTHTKKIDWRIYSFPQDRERFLTEALNIDHTELINILY